MATGVASSFTTVGRGRGRGRGLAGALKKPGLTLNKETGGDEGKPKETPLSDIIKELHAESVESTTREVKRRATLSDTGNNQDVIDRVVTLAFERALEDVDSTQFILALVEKLWMEEFSGGVSSKRPILQTAQNLYKSRENLKSYSESKFRGLCCLLCGVYGKLRIPAGSPPKDMPLKPLIGPVYNILNELLESDSVDSTLCFHQELTNTSFSKLLENGEPDKMNELVSQMRNRMLLGNLSSTQQCLLVEIIELHAGGWKMPDEIKSYYCDTITELLAGEQ